MNNYSFDSILILTWGFDPEQQGGIARFGLQLAEALQHAGIATELWGVLQINSVRERQERERLEQLGIKTRAFPRGKNEFYSVNIVTRALIHYAKTHPTAIISTHGALAELCGLIANALIPNPVIRTVHSEREWYKRPLLGKLVDRFSARWLKGEIGVSSRITAAINHRRKHHKAVWIPPISNFAIVEEFASFSQASARQLFNLPAHAWILGSVGRFTPQKGYDVLLKALALQPPSNLHVAILGDGPLAEQLSYQAQDLGIAERITWIEPTPQVGAFLQALDGYISSSRWEGLSLSVLEAAWCGLPIIASNVSGTQDIVQLLNVDLTTYDPEDTTHLGQILQFDNLQKLQRSAIRQDAGIFAVDAIAQRYLAYFASLMPH